MPELSAANYGLVEDGSYNLSGIANVTSASEVSLGDLQEFLKKTYCGSLSLEVDAIERWTLFQHLTPGSPLGLAHRQLEQRDPSRLGLGDPVSYSHTWYRAA